MGSFFTYLPIQVIHLSSYKKTILANGIRVVTETLPSPTVALGIFVDVGSRDEDEGNSGCAHFVEHMLFKGTAQRNAQQIARELDVLGGMANAFTAKETTCLHATVLGTQLTRTVSLFADLFLHSNYSEPDIRRERQVILQEIGMVEDNPEELVHELFAPLFWGNHPLGNTVLGQRKVVKAMSREQLLAFIARFYTAERMVIAAAGQLEHESLVELLAHHFGGVPRSSAGDHNGNPWPGRQRPVMQPVQRLVRTRAIEQVQILLGTDGLALASEDRYTLAVLNVLLGGNMSSRLFQEIREQRGLAYSIYSFPDSFRDCGMLGIAMGVGPESVNESLRLVGRELDNFRQGRLSEAELMDARDYAKSSMYLASESMEARMSRLAHNEECFGRDISLEESAAAIDRVTAAEIGSLAARLFSRPLTGLALGPIKGKQIDWSGL